jgi:hypothetical protein
MKPAPGLALTLLCLLAPGCMVIVGGHGSPGDEHYSGRGEHGPMCAAIDVASSISFSDDRAEALREIAVQTDLSEHEQMFLIDATVEAGGFSSDTVEVLITLAANPSLTPEARTHLGRRQHELSLFPSDRKRLATALTGTGTGASSDAGAGADAGAPDA